MRRILRPAQRQLASSSTSLPCSSLISNQHSNVNLRCANRWRIGGVNGLNLDAYFSCGRRFFHAAASASDEDPILAQAKKMFADFPNEDPRALSRRKYRRLAKLGPLAKAAPEEEETDESVLEAWVELFQNAADNLAYDNTASPIGVTHVEHRDPQMSDEVLLDEMSRPITFDFDDSDDDDKKGKKDADEDNKKT